MRDKLLVTYSSNYSRGRELGHFRTNPVNFMIRLTSESTAFYLGSVSVN